MKKNNPDVLLRKALALGDDIKEIESINIAESFKKTQSKIRTHKRKALYGRVVRYAAIMAIPLLFTSLILGYLHFNAPLPAETFAKVSATPGSVIRYELPDRTMVWLNSGSSLKHPTRFSKDHRSVELTGEAYFDVQASSEKPFYVHTADGLSIYVYGTKFNVTAYEDEEFIETVLERGKVSVTPPDKESIALLPGEHLLYNKKSHESVKNRIDVYEKVAWKDGKLVFRNAKLEDIFKRLERHYNVEIKFNNRYNKEYRYRATFRDETLPQILDYLSKSANLKWKVEESVQQNDDTLTKKRIIVELH